MSSTSCPRRAWWSSRVRVTFRSSMSPIASPGSSRTSSPRPSPTRGISRRCGPSFAAGRRRGPSSLRERRIAAALEVEPEQVSARVLAVAVVVGAHLGDLAVDEAKPLRTAVDPGLPRPGVAPGHGPFDHRLIILLDPVLVMPAGAEFVDAPFGVLGDLAAVVGPEPRVVVRRVSGEMRGDEVNVAGVERLVVGADVVEVRHPPGLSTIAS